MPASWIVLRCFCESYITRLLVGTIASLLTVRPLVALIACIARIAATWFFFHFIFFLSWTHNVFQQLQFLSIYYLSVLDKNVDFFLFPVECGANDFSCDNGFCIPASKRCDRRNDCQDASDERDCSYGLAYFH